MKTLVFTPPMTQINAPFPASAYLVGFLREQGYEAYQCDPALGTVLKLFSREGLSQMFETLEQLTVSKRHQDFKLREYFLEQKERYLNTIDPTIKFLQGKDPTLALRIATRHYLPEGPTFKGLSQFGSDLVAEEAEHELLHWAFGALGIQDKAKHLASLYLDDLTVFISHFIDPDFSLSRYAEKLAASSPSFEPLLQKLTEKPTLIDEMMFESLSEPMREIEPGVVAISVPFPGNVYAALRSAEWIKKNYPETKVLLGGGYVNTELRELEDPRVFNHIDAVIYDDGEAPLIRYLEMLSNKRGESGLIRTRLLKNGVVTYVNDSRGHDIPQKNLPAPCYDGLPLTDYLQVLEVLNPMHRIWSDGRWNKLTLAHGCYWKKCSFCDVTLDYIGRYDPSPVLKLVERMKVIADHTGQTGFHFVDEAAPPVILRELSKTLEAQGLSFTWWGNVRFEKQFTPELCKQLARAGCVAFSGGLEVASPRLLTKMNKGVTIEQVAQVTKAMSDAGILVHAYLMFGFPSQTEQETLDALERVRQLFLAGCLHSGFWHRFSVTAHSPIGKAPEEFGIKILEPALKGPRFSRNDLAFKDPVKADHDMLGRGLKRALFNYMHGAGLEEDVRVWFEKKLKPTTVPKDLIEKALLDS